MWNTWHPGEHVALPLMVLISLAYVIYCDVDLADLTADQKQGAFYPVHKSAVLLFYSQTASHEDLTYVSNMVSKLREIHASNMDLQK